MLIRGIPALIFLAVGCAPQTPYRYTLEAPNGARGTIALSPRATVGDLAAAFRGAFPAAEGCALGFDATANPGPAERVVRLMVVSGELRLPAHGYCGGSLLGSVGVQSVIVLSTDELSSGFRWCQKGKVTLLSTRGTIPSLQHDIERKLLSDHDIALAAWSTDDAHQTLAIVERFRTAGVSLILVDEGKPEFRSDHGLHRCEPHQEEAE